MKTVLFVCTANIARSPMAEVLFNKIADKKGFGGQFQARSAGTWARNGIPAPPHGQQVMSNRGLDTSNHLSREITESMISTASLVLTMEAGHKEALQVEFPAHREKVFMLSEMVGEEMDIDDPYFMGIEKYEETANELGNILDGGMIKILKLAGEKG